VGRRAYLRNSVVIASFQEDAEINRDGYAVVAIDVIRATTTAITAVAAGRRCFPVPSVEAALLPERQLPNALLPVEIAGVLREEDQICCAWLARELIAAGYEPEDERTSAIVDRWSTATVEACLCSKSVDYLRRSGQIRDLDFTLQHVNDLPHVFRMRDGEVV